MSFGNYTYILYIVSAAVLTALLFGLYLFWKSKIVKKIISSETVRKQVVLASPLLVKIKNSIIFISILLFAFILLRPMYGVDIKEVNNEGSDVLVALDVSLSMRARDVPPSRLDRAKSAVRWIAGSLKGDRIGLVLFAGDAFLQCPLTTDIGAFMMFLDGAGPSAIRLQGTDIGRALDEAAKVFKKKRVTSKILVLITDGEDNEGRAESSIDRFRELGVSVYAVGVGREQGEKIPAPAQNNKGDVYITDRNGTPISTRMRPDVLKKLAGETGGKYIDITRGISGLTQIIDVIEDQQKNKYESRIVHQPKEQFEIFAVLLIFLLMTELLMPERRGRD